MKSKTTLPALLAVVLLCLTATTTFSQASIPSIFERLTPSDGVPLSLSVDVSALMAEKNTAEYLPGTLGSADGATYKVEVRPRGKFRRKIATIPPLKVKFKKKALQADGLDTLNEIKLVLPCTLDSRGDELVIREYLAYRMFEKVSPASVRARLVDLTLLNTGTGNQSKYSVKAIVLEDEEETVARLGGRLEESFGILADSLQPAQAALNAMFQYMIGNTDWSIPEQRNVRLVRNGSGELLVIPFDFDFCGLVNAPYATPTASTGLRNVRERYLMADGIETDALSGALRALQNARQDFNQLCRSAPLPPQATANLAEYLDSFYRKVEKNDLKRLR